MPDWPIVFYPPPGEQDSPYDYIASLANPHEKAHIMRRLDVLGSTPQGAWPDRWMHKISDNIWQLTVGDNRIMYCLCEGTILVLHACRKKGKKARPKDIQRAEIHYAEFMERKRGLK
jgi:phage-related protein